MSSFWMIQDVHLKEKMIMFWKGQQKIAYKIKYSET